MAELHAKYRAHESEGWTPVLLDRRDAQIEIKTHAARVLAIWGAEYVEGLNFPVFDRQWLLRDRRIADAQLLIENDEDYGAVREMAPHLPHPRRRGLRQLWNSALIGGQLAWVIVVALLVITGWWFAR